MRAAGGNSDGNVLGIYRNLLVDQVVRAALFLGKIGAQGILCVHFGVFDLAGYLTAIQAQTQLFKRCNGNALRFVRYKRKGVCIDLISPATPQPQQHHAVFVSVYILDKVGACVDVRVGIDLADLLFVRAFLFHPVDIVAGDRCTISLNRQGTLDLLLAHALVKRQQDIRRFRRIGDIYRNCRRVFTAAVREHNGLQSRQHQSLLAVLKRHRLNDGRHAVVLPFPLGQLFDQLALKIPSLTLFEVGFDDIRKNDPRAHIIEPVRRLCHRAEVDIDVIKRILHALADADVADRKFRLSADDQLNIRLRQLCPSEAGDKEITGDLQDALHLAVGADAEMQILLATFDSRAAEGPQLDGGFQNDHIKLCTRQIELKRLRAGKVDARVGFISIFPLLPVELEGVAKAIDDG